METLETEAQDRRFTEIHTIRTDLAEGGEVSPLRMYVKG